MNVKVIIQLLLNQEMGFPFGSVVKNLPAKVGDARLILRSGRSPGEGNGDPFHCSCLGNPMARRAWQATVHVVAEESDMTQQLDNNKIIDDISNFSQLLTIKENMNKFENIIVLSFRRQYQKEYEMNINRENYSKNCTAKRVYVCVCVHVVKLTSEYLNISLRI